MSTIQQHSSGARWGVPQLDPERRQEPPDYIFICIAFTVFLLIGMAFALHKILRKDRRERKNLLSFRKKWYLWCTFCDRKSRSISLSGLRIKSYKSFSTRPPNDKITFDGESLKHDAWNEEDGWNPELTGSFRRKAFLPGDGDLPRTIGSCPDIIRSVEISVSAPRGKRSASAGSRIPTSSSSSSLVIIDENSEDDREDLFL
mmetsp:Transcript_1891/g.3423  ORF Transcript_1891/g.3423 Transcript_1891/m.3423 type:complete len:202 (+) Transcript_1891:249-854(+)